MSERLMAIRGFKRRMVIEFNAGNISVAQQLERSVARFEQMTDKQFISEYTREVCK